MDSQLESLKRLKAEADQAYFNGGEPIMSDGEYDRLCARVARVGIGEAGVGFVPPPTNRVKLPIPMASLNKCNDVKTLSLFLKKWPTSTTRFAVQDKLDGVSCLYVYDDGSVKLYTRGDGSIGTDVTGLVDQGLVLPDAPTGERLMVRGELIVAKKIFKNLFSHQYSNARNMVSGQIVSKSPDPRILEKLDFVAYELVSFGNQTQQSVVDQHHLLKSLGFKVVHSHVLDTVDVTRAGLAEYLTDRKLESAYDVDGLVLTATDPYVRSRVLENPKYSTAFKILGETASAVVVEVEWNMSKSGRYKPRVAIEPTRLGGVTISSVTGFNAKYVLDNAIVSGTKLTITRSGDVIPHILKVETTPGAVVELPKNSVMRGVELYHVFDNEQDLPAEMLIKKMVYFFSSLGCVHCKDKTVGKFFAAGLKNVEAVIREAVSKKPNVLTDQVGFAVAIKISASIVEQVQNRSLHELLAALNAFGEGIGLKKIQGINLSCLDGDAEPSLPIKGVSSATAREKIYPVLAARVARANAIKDIVSREKKEVPKKPKVYGDLFKGRSFAFTGFRDFRLEDAVIRNGGTLSATVSKTTSYLVFVEAPRRLGQVSTKTAKAESLGVTLIHKSDLEKMIQAQPVKPTIK